MSSTASWNEEKPLEKVTCTSSDCERDLHSFLRSIPARTILSKRKVPRLRCRPH